MAILKRIVLMGSLLSVFLVPFTKNTIWISHEGIASNNIEVAVDKAQSENEIGDANSIYCSCVKTAKYLGLDLTGISDASEIKPNSPLPKPGGGILFSYKTSYHIAVILKIDNSGFYVAEGNYKRCQYSERYVKAGNPSIVGFYNTSSTNTFFQAIVTAYSSSLDETSGDPFITASGKRVFDGVIACPRKYLFGTKFLISGKKYICYDRLAQRYDDRFDIWMESKDKAREFGKQILFIKVLSEG